MERYTTISGDVIEYEAPEANVAAFLARVVDATHDPGVSDAALTDLIYGKENPILRQDILPHHGVVTREVFDNPLYRVMTDLLGRKRAQRGIAPPPSSVGLTVQEVAAMHGVHASAIRQAIDAGRLRANKHGGAYVVAADDARAFQPARRGPKPRRVEVRMGSAPGASMSAKLSRGEWQGLEKKGGIITAHAERFERLAVYSGGEGKHRFFVLGPSPEENELRFGDFYVRGNFEVIEKENNPRRAREAWSSFGAAQSDYLRH